MTLPSSISRRASSVSTGSNNLIDLAPNNEDRSSVRVSILEEFDPILSSSDSSLRTISPDCAGNLPPMNEMYVVKNPVLDDSWSVCGSVYDEYDPYDFLYTGSGNNSLSDPIYAAVVKSENAPMSPPPPLPPRIHNSTLERKKSNLNALVS